jgi:hypothetical protein
VTSRGRRSDPSTLMNRGACGAVSEKMTTWRTFSPGRGRNNGRRGERGGRRLPADPGGKLRAEQEVGREQEPEEDKEVGRYGRRGDALCAAIQAWGDRRLG